MHTIVVRRNPKYSTALICPHNVGKLMAITLIYFGGGQVIMVPQGPTLPRDDHD